MTATKKKSPPADRASHHIIAGADLVADLSKDAPGVTYRYFYWVGSFPACPVEGLFCSGIAFPKVTQEIIQEKGTLEMQRVPRIGAIANLTKDKIDLLRERLPRTVIRFHDAPGEDDEPMAGSSLSDAQTRARRGHPVQIPSKAQIKKAKDAGNRPPPRYVAGPHDRPAAEYMFAVLCEDQENPRPGGVYPPSLAAAGLVWPEPME